MMYHGEAELDGNQSSGHLASRHVKELLEPRGGTFKSTPRIPPIPIVDCCWTPYGTLGLARPSHPVWFNIGLEGGVGARGVLCHVTIPRKRSMFETSHTSTLESKFNNDFREPFFAVVFFRPGNFPFATCVDPDVFLQRTLLPRLRCGFRTLHGLLVRTRSRAPKWDPNGNTPHTPWDPNGTQMGPKLSLKRICYLFGFYKKI